MPHYIRPHVGMGNHDNLAQLQKNRQHYLDRPQTYANNTRAQRRVAALTRQINQLENK